MISGVYAAGTNGYKMYRQDQLIGEGTRDVLTINDADTQYYIGQRLANYAGPLNAYISIGMIYNRALSSTEITQNYNAFKGRYGL
jgi:hypothetical protein